MTAKRKYIYVAFNKRRQKHNCFNACFAHERSWKDIAEANGHDPTTISKEIKNNQIISNPLKFNSKILCKKSDRFPYVWNLSKEIYDMHSKKYEAQAPLWYLDQLEDFIPLFLWFYIRISTFKITIERQNAYEKVGFCRVFEIICYIYSCK